jgi:NADH-quinone oxidoreductase subunit H
MNTITMSAIIVTLFLGGPQPISVGDWTADIPLIPNGLEGTVWFLLKLFVFLYMYVWFRATLPRLRYDQLMDLGWKLLIPVALAWFMFLAAMRVAQDEGWNRVMVGGIALVAIGLSALLLVVALRVGARRRAEEGAMF